MKRLRWFVVTGVLLVVVIAAFSRAVQQNAAPEADYMVAAPTNALQGGYGGDKADDGVFNRSVDQQGQQEPQQPVDGDVRRVVLKNAILTIVVDDVDAKMQAISDLSASFGGWIVNANTTHTNINGKNQVQSASITIRVPANRLDEAMKQIKSGVGTVEAENITGQDVTQDYVDLSSQLTNLQAAETQLQEIMSKAVRTQDVLDVYNQLVSVQGQIEQIQGRIRYYDESSSFASIQVTVLPTPIVQPVEIGGWRPLETARNAFQALINLLQGVADVVITVAIIGVPLAILIGVPVWIFWRRRRFARRTASAAA